MTATSFAVAPVLAALDDPVVGTRPRMTLLDTFSQSLVMAWRALKKMRRNPEQFSDVTIQPLLFTAMFAYVFGGAVSGDVAAYLPIMIPGILAMTTLTASMATGVQLREDMDTGVFNRFASMPMSRMAPLLGPMIADLVRYGIAACLTMATGIAMGYRPGGGVVGVVAALVLVVITGGRCRGSSRGSGRSRAARRPCRACRS